MGERRRADVGAGPVHEVDDARRQAGLLEQLHRVVGGERGRRGGLPDDGAPHQRRRARQVGADGREVERADREHETLERAVLEAVPDAGRGHGLLFVDARQVARVEPEEVDRLAGGVDLGLVRRLRLTEHRRRVEGVAPGPCQELGRAKQDRYPLFPGGTAPVLPGVGRRGDRLLDLGRAALVDVGEHVLLVVGHGRRAAAGRSAPPRPRSRTESRSAPACICCRRCCRLCAFGRPRRVTRGSARWPVEAGGRSRGALMARWYSRREGGSQGLPLLGARVGGRRGMARRRARRLARGATRGTGAGTGGLHPLAERSRRLLRGRAGDLRGRRDRARGVLGLPSRARSRSPPCAPRAGGLVRRAGCARRAARRTRARPGSFCARNRIAIVVPCHRVVAAEGLGSYGELGVDYKRRLLELEGWSERDVAV